MLLVDACCSRTQLIEAIYFSKLHICCPNFVAAIELDLEFSCLTELPRDAKIRICQWNGRLEGLDYCSS